MRALMAYRPSTPLAPFKGLLHPERRTAGSLADLDLFSRTLNPPPTRLEEYDVILNDHDNEWDMYFWMIGNKVRPIISPMAPPESLAPDAGGGWGGGDLAIFESVGNSPKDTKLVRKCLFGRCALIPLCMFGSSSVLVIAMPLLGRGCPF